MPFLATIPAGVIGAIGAVTSVVGTVVGVAGSLIGASQQAAAMRAQAAAQEAQAAQAQQIASYNAQIQRQNAQVAYQLATYQAQSQAQLAAMNQAAAVNNAAMAQVQATGARMQYDQGLLNAKQQELEAENVRAQGREEASRKREENEQRISQIRSRYGASGVTFEGSPLVVLSDAARLGESAVQDVVYATELESRKQYRAAEIEKFKAGFSLIDEMGYNVEAQNLRNQAARFGYESTLAEYDTAIAGARFRIGLNEARLTELAGGAQAYGMRAEAAQSRYAANASLIGGAFGAVSKGLSGISSAVGAYKPSAPALYNTSRAY
jgi:hypothetical protein